MPKRCRYSQSSSPCREHVTPGDSTECPSSAVSLSEAPVMPSDSVVLHDAEQTLQFLVYNKRKLEDELDESLGNLARVKKRIYILEGKVERLILAHVCDDSKHRMRKEIRFIKEEKHRVLDELKCIEDKLMEKLSRLKKC